MKYYEVIIRYEAGVNKSTQTSYVNRIAAVDASTGFDNCIEEIKEIESKDIAIYEAHIEEISKDRYDYYQKVNSN